MGCDATRYDAIGGVTKWCTLMVAEDVYWFAEAFYDISEHVQLGREASRVHREAFGIISRWIVELESRSYIASKSLLLHTGVSRWKIANVAHDVESSRRHSTKIFTYRK